MNLGTKLISGFGLFSLLLLIVVALGWNGLDTVTSGYKTLLADVVPIVNESYQIEGQIFQYRRNEKDFRLTESKKYWDKWNSAVATYEYRLEASSCSESVKQQQRPALMEYQNAQQAYLDSSDPEEKNELYEALRQHSHTMESSLSAVALPGTQKMLLEIRKQERIIYCAINLRTLKENSRPVINI